MGWWRHLRHVSGVRILWVPVVGSLLLLLQLHMLWEPDLEGTDHQGHHHRTKDPWSVVGYPRYSPPYNTSQLGLTFPFSPALLRHYGLVGTRTLRHVPTDVRDRLVLVTAASPDYYSSTLEAIFWAQVHMPRRKIIVYDLGMGPQSMFKGLKGCPCQTVYRQFNFSKYPEHVKRLSTYAWKFLIIKEVLEMHDAVFWIDSSIRLQKDLPPELGFGRSPVLLMAYTGHSNYAVTAPAMYDYLPTDRGRQKATSQYEANSMLIVNTHQAFHTVLKWVYACSLHEPCIAPHSVSTGCSFMGDSKGRYGNCHRFDQAAVNLVLANLHNYSYLDYVLENGDFRIFQVKRQQSFGGSILICGNKMCSTYALPRKSGFNSRNLIKRSTVNPFS